ncbi:MULTISPECIES: metallophosphoesterase family protein [Paenibacillus]|uniref:Metallophosphoesterase n=1 Tax=Paenibacillus campinasensis TaxID=66347 RepID=A0A268EX86_9BACL|nr:MULTISPECIES: metallophosphoesterase [Paenibacillus]MUG68287.1 metallophosphoesterase [Paenibacillus campinasensis]PAD77730.1 hypothetical protein CHH67_08800 [Paenibacillus campinasensis]PAK48050.1 hypothetical protein CHH75_23405 [Paenibacillus sp. 7541]
MTNQRLFRFHVLTDTHIEEEEGHLYNHHFRLALQDIAEHFPDSACIAHAGDLTNHGYPGEYRRYAAILAEFQGKLPPLYTVQGNHDVGTISPQDLKTYLASHAGAALAEEAAKLGLQAAHAGLAAIPEEYADLLPPAYMEQGHEAAGTWDNRIAAFLQATGQAGPYHHHVIRGAHFIFIGSETNDPLFCEFSEEQLAWLERTLDAVPDAKLPIFLFLHQPLLDTVSGSLAHQQWYGVRQDEELKRILSKHPRVVLFTGHTHWELGSPYTYVPATASSPSMLNCASVAYLWTDEDQRKEGSQGYVVDVYEDRTVVRGRDYRASDWIDGIEYTIAHQAYK